MLVFGRSMHANARRLSCGVKNVYKLSSLYVWPISSGGARMQVKKGPSVLICDNTSKD